MCAIDLPRIVLVDSQNALVGALTITSIPGKLFITLVSGSWLIVWTFFAPVARGLPFQSGEFRCISNFLLTCLSCSMVVDGSFSLFPHDCRACSYRQIFVLAIPQPSVQTFVRKTVVFVLVPCSPIVVLVHSRTSNAKFSFYQFSRVNNPKNFPQLTKCIFLVISVLVASTTAQP